MLLGGFDDRPFLISTWTMPEVQGVRGDPFFPWFRPVGVPEKEMEKLQEWFDMLRQLIDTC